MFQTVPSFDSTPSIHVPLKATLASLPIWSSVRLLLVRPGVAVGSPPSPSTPGHTFRSCIPCRNMLERSRPVSVTFGLKDFPRLPYQRFGSPVFAKQRDGCPPDWDGPARSINVPHRESNLGVLRKVRVLHRQPQPLVPAAKKSRVFKIYQTPKQKDSLMLTSNGCWRLCTRCGQAKPEAFLRRTPDMLRRGQSSSPGRDQRTSAWDLQEGPCSSSAPVFLLNCLWKRWRWGR